MRHLSDSGLDGKNFLSWIEFSNSNSLKKYLIQRNFNLTDDEATHLFAIITKYKKNKYSLKNKVNTNSDFLCLMKKVVNFF